MTFLCNDLLPSWAHTLRDIESEKPGRVLPVSAWKNTYHPHSDNIKSAQVNAHAVHKFKNHLVFLAAARCCKGGGMPRQTGVLLNVAGMILLCKLTTHLDRFLIRGSCNVYDVEVSMECPSINSSREIGNAKSELGARVRFHWRP